MISNRKSKIKHTSRSVVLFFIFLMSTTYTTKITVSPAYFGAVLLFACALAVFLKTPQFKINAANSVVVLLLSSITTLVAIHSVNLGSRLQDIINFAFGPLIYISALIICSSVSYERLKKISIAFIKWSLLLFSIELMLRLAFPNSALLAGEKTSLLSAGGSFYNYKFASFMYGDSNYVGLQLVILIGFILGLNSIEKKNTLRAPMLWMAFVLVIGSLSRASMIASVIVLSVYTLKFFNLKVKFFVFAVLSLILAFSGFHLVNDESLQSKFVILYLTLDAINNLDFRALMVGIGIGRTVDLIGIGAHNIIVLAALEAGGLFLLFFTIFVASKLVRRSTMFIALGLLVNGFSLATFAMPYFYLCLAILEALSKKNNPRLLGTLVNEKLLSERLLPAR